MKKVKSFLIRKCDFGSLHIGFETEKGVINTTTFQMADSKGIELAEFIKKLKNNKIIKISEVNTNGTNKK